MSKPSDLPIVTVDAISSDSSARPITQSTRRSGNCTWNAVYVNIDTIYPYMHGSGVTYASTELFKPETPQLYYADGEPQFGSEIFLMIAATYVFDPPNCFYQVSVNGEVKNISYVRTSLVPSRTNHFVTLKLNGNRVGPGETLRQSPPLECRRVTVKGIVLSTIQIENYYAK